MIAKVLVSSLRAAEEAYNNEIRCREIERYDNVKILEESVAEAMEQVITQGVLQGTDDARI